ncbi:MAG: UDP-N-acetylmuramate dehydrogenase [Puniceicoccaceae bacterium]
MNVRGERFFLLGIGGMGMLPLALFLKEGGAEVSGWDDALTPRAERLLREGGVALEPEPRAAARCGFLVVSSAISADHPLRRRLAENDPPPVVLRRGELLARIAAGRKLLAVAGSHGKTTTTALIAHLAGREGWAADHVIGGLPGAGLPPARNRGAEWLVAEIDESDGTIDGFSPEVTLFLNFDWDHADRYRDAGAIRATWAGLAGRTRSAVVHPEPAPGDGAPEWPDSPGRTAFPVDVADFAATNEAAARAAFAAAAGRPAGGDAAAGFPGVWRRQTIHARSGRFAVVEDYAHHPREVAAFLGWLARGDFPAPLRVYFQPHRFSRTTRFAGEFVEALSGLAEVGLHSVYGAGEATGGGDALARIEAGLEAGGVRVSRIRGLGDFPGFGEDEGAGPVGTFAFVGAGDANEWASVLAALAGEGGRPVPALLRLAEANLAAGTVRGGEPLERACTLRIGGRAAAFAEPDGVAALRWLLRAAGMLRIPVVFLGNGSNLLVSDEGFDGLVVHLKGPAWESVEAAEGGSLRIAAGAGCALPALARSAAKQGLAGFEFLEGIPGTVGGGLRMNAGAMGGWIGDRAVRVEALDPGGKLVCFDRSDLSFGYRSCPGLEGLCIIRAVFEGTERQDPEVIRQRMREYSIRRRGSQPGGASAGCMFRNPEGDSAGRLIDRAGLKGYRLGRVRVSEKHANFLLPDKNARAADVLALLSEIRERVRLRSGVWLEPEVRFLSPGNPAEVPPPTDSFRTVP